MGPRHAGDTLFRSRVFTGPREFRRRRCLVISGIGALVTYMSTVPGTRSFVRRSALIPPHQSP